MHKLKIIKKINLDSIAKYSEWPKKLLASKRFKKYKTKKEIIREFNDEKWKKIYKTLNKKKKYSISEAEKVLNNPEKTTICYDREKGFCLSKNKEINKYILKVIENKIKKHLTSASCLVELGAGFGSKILQLTKIFKNLVKLRRL
jgi:F0F1-type ATP synthase gamma subunit